jgi:hypothetical protein
LLPTLFQFGFGAILVLSHPSISGPADVLTTVAAGGVGSILALLALTVDETDEAFANIYSTAVSLQNYLPRASQRLLIVGVAIVATAISLGIDLTQYQQFLLLLGAFFVPPALHPRPCVRWTRVAARDDRRVDRGLLPLRVDRPDAGTRLLVGLPRTPASAPWRNRCVAPELRCRIRACRHGYASRPCGRSA